MIFHRFRENIGIIDAGKCRLPLTFETSDDESVLEGSRCTAKSKTRFEKFAWFVMTEECCLDFAIILSFDLPVCTISVQRRKISFLPYRVDKFFISQTEHYFRAVAVLTIWWLTRNRCFWFFWGTKTIGEARFLCAVLTTCFATILWISVYFFNSWVVGLVRLGAMCIRTEFGFESLILCFTTIIRPRYLSHVHWNFESISLNGLCFSLYLHVLQLLRSRLF